MVFIIPKKGQRQGWRLKMGDNKTNGEISFVRGDVVWIEDDSDNLQKNSIQAKSRPYLVIGNDLSNLHSPTITVIPLTTKCKNNLPTHCIVYLLHYNKKTHKCDTPVLNVVLCEQITAIAKNQVKRVIQHITEEEMKEVEKCVKIQLNL